jgi:hypothetical protein
LKRGRGEKKIRNLGDLREKRGWVGIREAVRKEVEE